MPSTGIICRSSSHRRFSEIHTWAQGHGESVSLGQGLMVQQFSGRLGLQHPCCGSRAVEAALSGCFMVFILTPARHTSQPMAPEEHPPLSLLVHLFCIDHPSAAQSCAGMVFTLFPSQPHALHAPDALLHTGVGCGLTDFCGADAVVCVHMCACVVCRTKSCRAWAGGKK